MSFSNGKRVNWSKEKLYSFMVQKGYSAQIGRYTRGQRQDMIV